MSGLGPLTLESLRDAARRRIVAVVVGVSIVSIFGVESCTSCATGEIVVNGQPQQLADLAGYTGFATFVMLGLWCVVLAGVLAAEHLTQTLADGTAVLVLSRPIGRETFAGARLLGALAIAGLTAVALLGTTAFLLRSRGELPLAPAAAGLGAVGLASITVGALAMAASLFLPRIATVLLVFAGVATMSTANLVGLVQRDPGGTLGLLDRLGPPLLGGVALAVAPWLEGVEIPADPLTTWLRLAAWAVGAVALLAVAFRRLELS